MKNTQASIRLVVFMTLLVTLGVYWPGVSGGFMFDDYANIVSIKELHLHHLDLQSLLLASQSGHAGPLGRPVSLVSFAVNHYFAGLDARAFKLVNLLIHCLTGLVIFRLTATLLHAHNRLSTNKDSPFSAELTAAVTAGIWLVHPLQLSTVLYVVQRMTSLSALFIFLALWLYLGGRLRQLEGKSGTIHFLVAFGFFFPLAVYSKENGLLLPLYLLLLEWTVLRFALPSDVSTRRFRQAAYVLVALAAGAAGTYLFTHPGIILGGYENRSFSLIERLLTEPRVLWFYIGLIFVPSTLRLGLFHDDIGLSEDLLTPPTTLAAILGLVLLVWLAVHLRRKMPVFSFGVLFFFTGHLLESTVFPLELAFEHRNYLPSYGLLLTLCYSLMNTPTYLFSSKTVPLTIVFAFAVVLSASTFSRALSWSAPLSFAISEAAHHPHSARAQYELGRIYADIINIDPEAVHLYPLTTMTLESSSKLDPSNNDGLFRLLPLSQRFSSDIPREWTSTLLDRLAHGVYPANNVNMLSWLVNCDENNVSCHIPNDLLAKLLTASLENPNLRGRERSEVCVLGSKFFLIKMRDPDTALALIAAAAETSPNIPRFRIYLAQLLIELGRVSDAQQELKIARMLDSFGTHKSRIDELLLATK